MNNSSDIGGNIMSGRDGDNNINDTNIANINTNINNNDIAKKDFIIYYRF